MSPAPVRDLQSRVCVVTGANTGIGRVIATSLARRGAQVVLACRSAEKTAPVLEAIRRETPGAGVEHLPLDLGSLASVRAAAAALLARDRPIHVLINNAGVAWVPGTTADGFEVAFGVNHLGHFLFTTLLLGRLRASAPARVVTLSSRAHYRARRIDFTAVTRPAASMGGLREYCVSKLANALFSRELGRRLAGTGITTYAVHPGLIASDIWRRIPWPVRPLMIATLRMRSNEEGAQGPLRCATAPELALETGRYYHGGEPRAPSRFAEDDALAAELWARSEVFCAQPPR
jgi:retinol dehydrogenase-12